MPPISTRSIICLVSNPRWRGHIVDFVAAAMGKPDRHAARPPDTYPDRYRAAGQGQQD
jgi:hypothetical protein